MACISRVGTRSCNSKRLMITQNDIIQEVSGCRASHSTGPFLPTTICLLMSVYFRLLSVSTPTFRRISKTRKLQAIEASQNDSWVISWAIPIPTVAYMNTYSHKHLNHAESESLIDKNQCIKPCGSRAGDNAMLNRKVHASYLLAASLSWQTSSEMGEEGASFHSEQQGLTALVNFYLQYLV